MTSFNGTFLMGGNMKNKNIIRFYMLANSLKEKLRTGYIEIGIEKERTESVAEHIYGTLILAIAIDSEYSLDLDMLKVLKMLILHETEEILMPDFTVRANITPEEKIKMGKTCVHQVVKDLYKSQELENLLDEFNERKTKEAKFCFLIDKIECDFQAKMYDLQGVMSYDKTKEDLKYYGDRAEEIEKNSHTASDFWIEYDKPKYQDDEIFKSLIKDIQSTNKLVKEQSYVR